ncbi:phosphoglycerate mutase-like protein [Patellaria atrata CBS 101060]|uniref:Phosphoglycerate mutase-like protein n=1 Tax=Patellaria atrata CBS 101060 TaxID=1346257 RepID=A0A9P4VSB5_9PEZI|nr:phosphoglycerate mutase-like protein [Patellaria atrata CBS 101060]
MRLFLIRHGETVDNIAQVYAGSRDSELTNHGVQQAQRLGRYFNTTGVRFTHLFSSHLQRAYKTAEYIRSAQASEDGDTDSANAIQVQQLPILMEQDFGWYEGKTWHDKPKKSEKSSKEIFQEEKQNNPDFVDMESKESLAKRADGFLDEHLTPLLEYSNPENDLIIAVVSHGIMLTHLWRRLLLRLPPHSVRLTPELLANQRMIILEHLGGWSNTGFLELEMNKTRAVERSPPDDTVEGPANSVPDEVAKALEEAIVDDVITSNEGRNRVSSPNPSKSIPSSTESPTTTTAPRLLHGWTTTIKVINGREHVKGLKRTGGGVGSSKHDGSQKSLESFFKRKKL